MRLWEVWETYVHGQLLAVRHCLDEVQVRAVAQEGGHRLSNYSWNDGDVGAEKVILVLGYFASDFVLACASRQQPSLRLCGFGLWDGTTARQCCEQTMGIAIRLFSLYSQSQERVRTGS